MSEKRALRRKMRAVRDAIPPEQREAFSQQICAAAAELVQPGEMVFVYASIGSEVKTGGLIRTLWAKGCRVCLPQIIAEGHMEAALYAPGDALERDRYGILAPIHGQIIAPEQVKTAFVPGLAFDGAGNRLGYGGGYYDRWLARTKARQIGLGYVRQLVERVPAEPWDVRLDAVVTEQEKRRFR